VWPLLACGGACGDCDGEQVQNQGLPLVQRIEGRCFNGAPDAETREGEDGGRAFDSGGICPSQLRCPGTLYGNVCITRVSASCENGSAAAYCNGVAASRVATQAEFLAIIAAGWQRPNSDYHTMSVDRVPGCNNGPGAVRVPGYGDPNSVYQCGDNLAYCRRAILCALR